MKNFVSKIVLWLGVTMACQLPAQTFTMLHTFAALPLTSPYINSNGGEPSGLMVASNTLYGTTVYGGNAGCGTVYSLATNGQNFASIYAFPTSANFSPNSGGSIPEGQLLLLDGTLMGTAEGGGTGGGGTIFTMDTSGQNLGTVYNFSAPDPDNNYVNVGGAEPDVGVILSGDTLYGTTYLGGSSGAGTVFSVGTNGLGLLSLHEFSAVPVSPPYGNPDGADPVGGLVLSSNVLYGVAGGGGTNGFGTVYAVNAGGGGFTVLHHFSNETGKFFTNSEGSAPTFLLLSGVTLYGTTHEGGSHDDGTLFAINTDGTGLRNLHNFTGTTNGESPNSLVLVDDTLYGSTSQGGAAAPNGAGNSGTLFAINTNGSTFRILHEFGPSGFDNANFLTTNSDGISPEHLVYENGTLYGVTDRGGSTGAGTVFSQTVVPFTALTVSVTSLPEGTNGEVYSQALTASGGATPYSWKLNSGSLPKGLKLATDGTVSGTPTAGGTFSFTVEVKDALAATATQLITLEIFTPDTAAPTLTISSPKTGAKWSNSVTYLVAGTTKDNDGVANVLISVNGSDWAGAATTDNWTNWTASVNLSAGTNSISAYAVDGSGNNSPTSTVKLIFIETASLVVSTNGDGTVSPDYNGDNLDIGINYSMTAKAAKGSDFVKWTDGDGTLLTTNTALKFDMASGFVFVAHFVDVTKPTASITSPKANAKVTTPTVTVTGKAADNVGVTNVWYQINNGGWFTATSTGVGFTTWAVSNLTVAAGANVIQAYAADAAGNLSTTNEVKFTGIP